MTNFFGFQLFRHWSREIATNSGRIKLRDFFNVIMIFSFCCMIEFLKTFLYFFVLYLGIRRRRCRLKAPFLNFVVRWLAMILCLARAQSWHTVDSYYLGQNFTNNSGDLAFFRSTCPNNQNAITGDDEFWKTDFSWKQVKSKSYNFRDSFFW